MGPIKIFVFDHWKPLESFGYISPYFSINSDTIIHTWVVMGIIFAFAIFGRIVIKHTRSIPKFFYVFYGESFMDLCSQIIGKFSFKHYAFASSLFTFILVCNCISIIPWFEEPTQDLNTALALGIVTFIYIHASTIQERGLWYYIKEYFHPFVFMLPLNLIEKLAKVVSISFRLFGNIFGGSIITQIVHGTTDTNIIWGTLGIISGMNILLTLFFCLFEGFIQAFVFAMLTITYLSLAINTEETGEHAA